MIDRRRLLGGLSMYVRIHHNDRPMSLIGGYQGMFVSITMIDRLSLLGGGCPSILVFITIHTYITYIHVRVYIHIDVCRYLFVELN